MSKLYALLLAVLFLLTACAYESPVFVTATPVGSEVPTIVNNMTIEPDVTATQAIVTNTPSLTVTKGVPQSVCNRISYNINGFAVADWTYLKQHLVNIRPCSVLMMGDSGRALELMDLLPDTLVVFRAYHESDGSQCIVDPPRNQVDTFIAVFTNKAREMGLPENSYQRIALYGCSNEPSFGGDTSLQRILDAEIVFMNYARSKGITVVSGNWAVGTIQPEHVESGMFRDYLWALANGNHYMGVHEYTTYFLPFGTG
ncbi:MAG: hypothetical protein Q9P44_18610, partial [Anaerolineae bacterium]|nr:hypothetical protein [Anaerolineae bacterium]